MTEFSLASYLVTDTDPIVAAFGSQDPAIKAQVLDRTAPIIREFGGDAGQNRIADGLDRIIAAPRIEAYHWHMALATEMLFAAYGTRPTKAANISVSGYPENFVDPLTALGLPAAADALDVLAYSQEVRIPVPVDRWDSVSGQFYFDALAAAAAAAALAGLGSLQSAVDDLEHKKPDLFEDCDPDDLVVLLESLSALLKQAASAGAGLAIFRHGGV